MRAFSRHRFFLLPGPCVPNALQSRLRARVVRLQVQRAQQQLLRVAVGPSRAAQMLLGFRNQLVLESRLQLKHPLP